MSQQLLTVDELWDETQRLTAELEQVQSRLARLQSGTTGVEIEADDEDVWNVWPYSWARDGWEKSRDFSRGRLHSFQGKLCDGSLATWRLAWENKKQRIRFWQTPHPEEISLEIV
ncbi:MAG TPA: hypothetical protein VF719_03390 [Abditibacteriaceae bacterium]|jgi:hypothetical protein